MDLIETGLSNPIQHWYYAHKFSAIKSILNSSLYDEKKLIDVGAGSALFSLRFLLEFPKLKVVAIDTNYDFVETKMPNNRITYKNSGTGVSGDLYLFTDVLEHVLDDVGMLGAYVRHAPSGSKFVITVPAFMSLWSGHDVYLKHFRRYRKNEIENVIELAGLKITQSRYLFTSLFPIAWLMRRFRASKSEVSQMKDHGKLLNWVALQVLKLDQVMSKFLPFGVSVIVLAEK